jgi:hypothetical protein
MAADLHNSVELALPFSRLPISTSGWLDSPSVTRFPKVLKKHEVTADTIDPAKPTKSDQLFPLKNSEKYPCIPISVRILCSQLCSEQMISRFRPLIGSFRRVWLAKSIGNLRAKSGIFGHYRARIGHRFSKTTWQPAFFDQKRGFWWARS